MKMSKQEAIQELIKLNKIDSKTQAVNAVGSNGLLE